MYYTKIIFNTLEMQLYEHLKKYITFLDATHRTHSVILIFYEIPHKTPLLFKHDPS